VNCIAPRPHYTVRLPDRDPLSLGDRCLVMGILNVTPDSFADSKPLLEAENAVAAALRMEADGADLIDIGGESTRPGADPLPAAEELRRVLPVLRALRGRVGIPLSIDTCKSGVAAAAIEAGAVMVNDVSGLQRDPALAGEVARTGVALILMHSRGSSKTMYAEASYGDVLADVIGELRGSMATAVDAGVRREQILVDPGVGFAKRASHSYGVLAGLPELSAALDRPLLVGPSRKSFLREALGGRPPLERDWGTAAAVTAAVLAGAHVVRVHAVAEMAQVVRVAEQIRRHGHQP
jgi:dihydropteroate synthase